MTHPATAHRDHPDAGAPRHPLARLAAWLDTRADDADASAAAAGLHAWAPSRWSRVYRDARFADRDGDR